MKLSPEWLVLQHWLKSSGRFRCSAAIMPVLLLIGAQLMAGCTAVSAGPKIQFDREEVDFGCVVVGSPVKVTFSFKNVGDANLELLGVHSSCDCTVCQCLTNTIAPGKSSAINVVFDSSGYAGLIAKLVNVRTNDPNKSALTLTLLGNVDSVATFVPSSVDFGTVKPNRTYTAILEVMPNNPKSFVIDKVESDGKRVRARGFRKIVDNAGVRWAIDVDLSAGSDAEKICESIAISARAGSSVMLRALVLATVADE